MIMELGRRNILDHNVTAHPTAEWTLQQFREALRGGHHEARVEQLRTTDYSPVYTEHQPRCENEFWVECTHKNI